jgi:hypothetical protein
MGFSLARTMNPESGIDATVVSQLLQVLGFLLILQFDLHHDALRVLEHTYRACPIGQPFDIEPIWLGLRELVAGSVVLAVQYSFPILGLMLLLSVGMVLLGRAVPNINLMEFGFALRVLLAIGAMAYFLGEGTPFLLQTFRSVLERSARRMFPSLRPWRLFGDDQGKTEKPTPSRLAEVRNRGDSPLSRELVQGGVLLVAAIALKWIGGWLIDALGQVMRRGLDVDLAEHQVADVGGLPRVHRDVPASSGRRS